MAWGFGQSKRDVSAKEFRKRLKSHKEACHSEGGIPEEECEACKKLKQLAKEAKKRERG